MGDSEGNGIDGCGGKGSHPSTSLDCALWTWQKRNWAILSVVAFEELGIGVVPVVAVVLVGGLSWLRMLRWGCDFEANE